MDISSMNDLLQMDIDKCLEEFKKLSKGNLTNLVQLFKIQYEQVNNLKTSLLVVIENHETGKEKMSLELYTEHISALDNLYLALQLIEDRYMVASQLLESYEIEEQKRLEALKYE